MEPITTESDNVAPFAALSDDELVERVKDLAACERRASVALIRSLVEFDARRLYLREGCSSLFTYCTHVLHLSEGSAYNRIETARAARRYPEVLDALERGDFTLTAVRLLAPHLTPANHGEVLAAARHRSKQGIQELIASLNPRPAAAAMIRRVARNRRTVISSRSLCAGRSQAAAKTSTHPWRAGPPPAPHRGRRDATRAGSLQGADDGGARDARKAAPRAGAARAHDARWRLRGDPRSRVDAAVDDLERRRFARDASPPPARTTVCIGTFRLRPGARCGHRDGRPVRIRRQRTGRCSELAVSSSSIT